LRQPENHRSLRGWRLRGIPQSPGKSHEIPDALSSIEAAPLFRAGVTVYRALQKAKILAGQRVAIFGVGATVFRISRDSRSIRYRYSDGTQWVKTALGLAAPLSFLCVSGNQNRHQFNVAVEFAG